LNDIPEVSYADFRARYFRWRQGEHVSLIGPTGGGKTTLALDILPMRKFDVVFGVKPRDDTLSDLLKQSQWQRMYGWDTIKAKELKRVVLWPKMESPEDMGVQAKVFGQALRGIFRAGSFCVFADELRYLCETLRLRRYFELLWMQGRSLGISLVASAQRPAFVPTLLYDQATHLFFWRDNDELNLKRIGGIGWLNSQEIRKRVASLPYIPEHGGHFLYINTRTGLMVVSKVEVKK
jgi:hypothetical protein